MIKFPCNESVMCDKICIVSLICDIKLHPIINCLTSVLPWEYNYRKSSLYRKLNNNAQFANILKQIFQGASGRNYILFIIIPIVLTFYKQVWFCICFCFCFCTFFSYSFTNYEEKAGKKGHFWKIITQTSFNSV